MIKDHDPAIYGKKKEPMGVNKPLRFVGLKLDEKDLAEEIAMDLDLPKDVVLLVINQLIRRIVYHMVHDHELAFNYFGRFRLRRGHRHWVIQFMRMRSLDSYLNARLDNDANQKSIIRINPLVSHSWYEYEIVHRDTHSLLDVEPSEKVKRQ